MAEQFKGPTALRVQRIDGAPPEAGRPPDALHAALVRGEPTALAEVWARFAPVVRGLLRRGLGADHDVDDLVQETFLTFFRRIGSLRDPNALRPFLLTITTNLLRDELRSRKRRFLFAPRAGGAEAADEPLAPGPNTDAREALRRFYRVLDRLDPTERTAFVLRFVEDIDLAEIATVMSLSLTTLKRRLRRAAERVESLVAADPGLAEFLSGDTRWTTGETHET